MPGEWLPVSTLPPEAQQAIQQGDSLDPVDTLDAAQLSEMARQSEGAFSPVQWATANPERATDPAIVKKLADAHAIYRESTSLKDLPSPGKFIKSAGHAVKGVAKQAFNYAQAFLGTPLAAIAGEITGQPAGFQEELEKEAERQNIETLAGTEQAIFGLSQLPAKAARVVGHKIGTATGLAKPYDQQTDEEKQQAFFRDLGVAKTQADISTGRGGLTGAVAGQTVTELEEAGKPVRPEEVETLAAGDPLSFVLFGKAFQGLGRGAAAVVPARAAAVSQKAAQAVAEAAPVVGGKVIESAGKLTELGGKAAQVAGKVAPVAAAAGAIVSGEPVAGLAILGGGTVAGRALTKIGAGVERAGERIGGVGAQVAGKIPVTSPYAQAAYDILQTAPLATAGVLKGAAFDLGLAAATSETPQELEAANALGTVLTGLQGVGRVALSVARGQIITPRQWGTAAATPSYGSFRSLDAAHATAQQSAAPGQVQRANAIREFLRGAGDTVQAYLMPDAAAMEKALTEIYQREGLDLPQAQQRAKDAAQAGGMFETSLRDDSGQSRRVVLLKDADVAPHESFHGIQDVLGEQANSVIDALVYNEYANQWEQIGQEYAARLGMKPGQNWREAILDLSRWGNAEAAEKAMRDAANQLESQTGAVPRREDVRALAESVLQKARKSGAGWREILTPEEASAVADRYLARELAAENFDAAFKNLGVGLTEGQTLPEKLARVVARTAQFFGAEPLAGARTEILGIEPRLAVTRATTDLGRSLIQPKQPRRAAAPAAPRAPGLPRGTAPVTGEQRQSESAKIVQQADEIAARNPQTSEILRKIASAVASGTGLKVDYRAAAGEPGGAGAARSVRRKEIEAFRNVPESVRPLFEKLNFPDRVELTKNKGLQILGWSPENYAANAQKMAEFILNMQAKLPEAANWSPYELDAKTKSFTPEGWKQLYDDAQTFVRNQQAGGTGSGRPLQVPPEATAAGAVVPELRPGILVPLNQHAADFHNLLFNIMLPETTRVSRAGRTPGNILAQDIARANEPLIGPRVTEPGRPRRVSKTTGEVQEFPGFPGRRIQEVNPLRGEMERAAQQTKITFPELIEVSQRLNLEHIADVTLAPEAPPIRGVTDTLRAGFAPEPLKGTAKEIADRITKLSPGQFKATVTNFEGKYGGGQTGLSFELGSQVRNAADIATYAESLRGLDAALEQARANKDIDAIFSIPAKKQFFRELLETATDGTSADFIRKNYDPNYEAPFPKVQFIAKTQVGKEFEKRGYEFRVSGSPGYRSVSVSKGGTEVGEILANALPRGTGEEVIIANAYLEKPERGKGLGEALYREMATQLQSDGVRAVVGNVVAPEPLALREKVFGPGSTQVDVNFEPATIQQALREAATIGKRTPEGEIQFASIEARNEIRPGMQFAPSKNPDAIKEAAIKFPDGKMITGPHHGAAELKVAGKVPAKSEYGFVTNSGEFLTRKDAFERATEIGQIDPNDIPEDAGGYLESFEFQETRQFAPKPNDEVRDVAAEYAKSAGIDYTPAPVYRQVSEPLAKKLADFYESAKSTPDDPAVKSSYGALADETVKQYAAITNAGYTVEPWDGQGEPYKNSEAALADIRDNKHLYFLRTEGNFAGATDNPMLADSGIEINGQPLSVNDVFRAVHDFFGHGKEGYQFGQRGEFNAWAAHSEMYSPEARGALAAETLAQNSWVNFGSHLRNESGNVPVKGQPGYRPLTERPFAEQKAVIVPDELIAEAKAQFAPKKAKDETKILPGGTDGISKAWILPSGKIKQLGAQWHHDWLDQNKDVQAKYKLDIPPFEGSDTEGARESALRAGFVRVNYSRNTGTLTVEARAKDWRKAKPAVEKLVEENLDDIDNMTVHLLDESVKKVVDSDSERLFRHDEDTDKLANLPFITKGEARGGTTQFSPAGEKPFANETFDAELKKIRAGSIGGQTFNADGTTWEAGKDPVDVVTLASVNVPAGSVNRDAVVKALGPYEELLAEPGVVAGVFSFSKEGKPTVSIDVNAVVPQKHRDNSVAFAKANDQVAIWDSAKQEEVRTGGKGNTKLKEVDQILTALDDLKRGKPVDVEQILSESEVGDLAETAELPGLGVGREFNQAAISKMTRAELAKHFPEAVIPRRSNDEISSDVVNSPLAKAAGSRESAAKSFARKLVEFYREYEDSPELQAGSKWYSDFTPMLKKEFGPDARLFAELLAATSPNTEPAVNFGFAFDAYSNFKAGKFDKLVSKFNEGLDKLADGGLEAVYNRDLKAGKVVNPPENPSEATYLAHWIDKHNLLPKGSSGKRFGMHSVPVLKVLARKWMKLNTGPKTENFVKNLLGEGDDATVDVWFDRTMRRLGYAGTKERWRILPRNKTSVTDADFAFSQEAAREAAKELGITPSSLQGALWFAEKHLWSQNGWGRLDLGDFRKEMTKLPLLRAGFAQRQAAAKRQEKKPKMEQIELIQPKKK